DRERVLRHDPAEAPHQARRAAAARVARARRRVRRGAADGPRSVRADRHHAADVQISGCFSPALPADGQPARQSARDRRSAAQFAEGRGARQRTRPYARARRRGSAARRLGDGGGRAMRAHPAVPRPALRLRELIASGRTIAALGATDALSARIIASHGYECIYIGSYATAASRLALPDTGALALPELVEQARTIVNAVDVPVIADAEAGFH